MKTTIKCDLRQILTLKVPSKKIRPDRDKKICIEEVQKNPIFQIFAGKIFLNVHRRIFFTALPRILINTKSKRRFLGRKEKKQKIFISNFHDPGECDFGRFHFLYYNDLVGVTRFQGSGWVLWTEKIEYVVSIILSGCRKKLVVNLWEKCCFLCLWNCEYIFGIRFANYKAG
jgi:hypothetical protein